MAKTINDYAKTYLQVGEAYLRIKLLKEDIGELDLETLQFLAGQVPGNDPRIPFDQNDREFYRKLTSWGIIELSGVLTTQEQRDALSRNRKRHIEEKLKEIKFMQTQPAARKSSPAKTESAKKVETKKVEPKKSEPKTPPVATAEQKTKAKAAPVPTKPTPTKKEAKKEPVKTSATAKKEAGSRRPEKTKTAIKAKSNGTSADTALFRTCGMTIVPTDQFVLKTTKLGDKYSDGSWRKEIADVFRKKVAVMQAFNKVTALRKSGVINANSKDWPDRRYVRIVVKELTRAKALKRFEG